MTSLPPELVAGYRRFRSSRYQEEANRYADLKDGQSPDTMIIACADSRVDPATIFGAAPGELFVVRNVANLVPPCAATLRSLHGTSAAVEFAIAELGVKHIVVMGHGGCGGVAASLATAENRSIGSFIAPWVDLLSPARDKIIADKTLKNPAARQHALEQLGIRLSLENLMTFPFVASAVADGSIMLHGTWFSIGDGILHWLNEDTGAFEFITA